MKIFIQKVDEIGCYEVYSIAYNLIYPKKHPHEPCATRNNNKNLRNAVADAYRPPPQNHHPFLPSILFIDRYRDVHHGPRR